MRRIREVLRLRAELGPNSECHIGRREAGALDGAGVSGIERRRQGWTPRPPMGCRRRRWRWRFTRRPRPPMVAHCPTGRRWIRNCGATSTSRASCFGWRTRAADPDGLGFSQFKLRLSEWQKASGRGLLMRQVHHAGETVQVDYAGDTVAVTRCTVRRVRRRYSWPACRVRG